MALPAVAAAALKYGPAAYGLIKGLFGKKSPRDKALERIQQTAERGLDRGVLDQALAILNARNQGEQGDILSRMAAGGIDPSSGLAQEAVGASRRSLGARRGEASALFNEQSELAKQRANELLAGQPEDTSTGDLLGSLLTNLSQEKFLQPKEPSSVYDELVKSQPQSLETTPRGLMVRSPQLIQQLPETAYARQMTPRKAIFPKTYARSPQLIQKEYPRSIMTTLRRRY